MKIVYVIGRYRATTEHGVVENIRAAEAVAIEVWKAGAAALCPHKNTALLGGVVPDESFLAGDIEMLRRCDAAICVPGWETSAGSIGEMKVCADIGMPVFLEIAELVGWLNEVEPE